MNNRESLHSKKIDSLRKPKNGFIDIKNLLNWFKCRNKLVLKSVKPKKVLHLDPPTNPFKVSYNAYKPVAQPEKF